MDLNGTLRDFARSGWTYIGVDLEPGKGVDQLLKEGEPLPFEAGYFDAVISSSALEHDPFFWQTFLELVRVLRPGGVLYLNVPSNGDFHRHKKDCWRFYPDAGGALTKWASASGLNIILLESFIAERAADIWNDFVAIFWKPD